MTNICKCQGHRGQLKEYDSEAEAQDAAEYVQSRYGNNMIPYLGVCGKWHLSPKDRHTPSVLCKHCEKQLYETKAGAERRADILFDEQEVLLKVYPCPFHARGWHLTSSDY